MRLRRTASGGRKGARHVFRIYVQVTDCLTEIHNVRWMMLAVRQMALPCFGQLTVPIIPNHPSVQWDEMVAATRESPASGYALEVDGRLKREFATRDGATAGGEELKTLFPMLRCFG